MGILSKRFFDRLDEARFGDIQVWDFSFRSLLREYTWVFFLKAVLAHPVKTVRGLRRYRHFIREKKHPGPEYVRLLSIPDDAIFLQNVRARKSGPLIGLGFCLKPHEPNDSSASCPSGRANHDCLYLERGETRPVCAGCVIHEIGRLAAAIRTSGKGGIKCRNTLTSPFICSVNHIPPEPAPQASGNFLF